MLFYRVGVEADGKTWNFTRLWAANYPSQTNVLIYEKDLKLLIVGLDSGKVHIYGIQENQKGHVTGL